MNRMMNFFLKEPKPFTSKREVDWKLVKLFGYSLLALILLGIIFYPNSQTISSTFYEKAENGSLSSVPSSENDPTQETVRQLQASQVNASSVHRNLDHLYRGDSRIAQIRSGATGSEDRNGSMIVNPGGADARNKLTAGTKITIEIYDKILVSDETMPIVGYVSKEVLTENVSAIPKGAKVLGEASFNESTGRASISWRSIIFPDGREKPFSAMGVGSDGQIGIVGKVYSEGVKNAVGQTLTRFVGAYASGSLKTGAFGENKGGHVNGMRNAIAQTATDRANAMGEHLQKERKWIEVNGGSQTSAILSQAFSYRDEGGAPGR